MKWQDAFRAEEWSDLEHCLSSACKHGGEMPEATALAIEAMSTKIRSVEADRVLKHRSDRSHLAPENQPIQAAIDTLLFRCYGLSDDDARYIERRLEEML